MKKLTSNELAPEDDTQGVLSKEDAVNIAHANASQGPKDLSLYNVIANLLDDGWHVVYLPKEEGMRGGGGPHYVIDLHTGAIVSKTYER